MPRRAGKLSPLRAVVVEWSRSRQRYERQGILATPQAIAQAETDSLADADARERQRARAALRLAVIAHIRHQHTDYDRRLGRHGDRVLARQEIQGALGRMLEQWERPAPPPSKV